MTTDEQYMTRCLQLAANGLGRVRPNPLVGCVVVNNGAIVAEGYHQQWGQNHAERNAILHCPQPQYLPGSTLYVNLEPCSHFGLTPPCANLIVEHQIARVVVCNDDPNPKVHGRGYQILRDAGIEVLTHVLNDKGRFLNRRFFTFQEEHRPYIILKWAESSNGMMDIDRSKEPCGNYWITNTALKQLSHRWRTEEAAILVGSETYLNDRPQLNARLWKGQDPLPIVLDRRHRLQDLPPHWLHLSCNTLPEVLEQLYSNNVQSLIVEGGRTILQAFLQAGLWDEIRQLQGSCTILDGTSAPKIDLTPSHSDTYHDNTVNYYYRTFQYIP